MCDTPTRYFLILAVLLFSLCERKKKYIKKIKYHSTEG